MYGAVGAIGVGLLGMIVVLAMGRGKADGERHPRRSRSRPTA